MNGDLDLKKRQNLLTRIKSTFHYTWTIVSETGPKRKSMFHTNWSQSSRSILCNMYITHNIWQIFASKCHNLANWTLLVKSWKCIIHLALFFFKDLFVIYTNLSHNLMLHNVVLFFLPLRQQYISLQIRKFQNLYHLIYNFLFDFFLSCVLNTTGILFWWS